MLVYLEQHVKHGITPFRNSAKVLNVEAAAMYVCVHACISVLCLYVCNICICVCMCECMCVCIVTAVF